MQSSTNTPSPKPVRFIPQAQKDFGFDSHTGDSEASGLNSQALARSLELPGAAAFFLKRCFRCHPGPYRVSPHQTRAVSLQNQPIEKSTLLIPGAGRGCSIPAVRSYIAPVSILCVYSSWRFSESEIRKFLVGFARYRSQ